MAEYLSKFQYGEKFERLPLGMSFGSGVIRLDFTQTKVDMVPAGLTGIKYLEFFKKPLYISPDYEGQVIYSEGAYSLAGCDFMDDDEIEAAKKRYTENREFVEKPRYVENEDGSLSLCSLPTNMRIISKPYKGFYLDLTQTDVIEKQEFKGFQGTILYPKRSTLSNAPQKVMHHKGCQMVHSKPRIKE